MDHDHGAAFSFGSPFRSLTPTMPYQPLTAALPQDARYGAAAKFDFDNPNKWVTVPGVPLLDEHEMTDEDGRPVAYVDRQALAEIAANNNKRVYETGDPATLILGHTSDDPRAPEKPAKGFVVNYRVKPFKRDPKTGQVIYAIHGDYKLRPQNAKLVEEFPRRSVELWWNKKELDPIAMLGGTTPERDLGAVIRKGRLNNVVLGSTETYTRGTKRQQSEPEVIKFHSHGSWTIESYAIDDTPKERTMPTPRRNNGPARYNHGNPSRYEAFGGAPGTIDPIEGEGGDDGMGGEDDPLVAKVFQSKQFKGLEAKLDMILAALQGGEGGGEEGLGGEPGMEGLEGPEGLEGEEGLPGGIEGGMEGDEGGAPGEGYEGDEGGEGMEPEAREEHGEDPVRFEEGNTEEGNEGEDEEAPAPIRHSASGFGGPTSINIPAFGGGKGKPKPKPVTNYSRNGVTPVRTQQRDPEVIRLRRHVEGLQLKLSRADAREIVNQLEAEGILFGDTPQEAAQGKAEEIEFLALLGEDDRAYHVNNVIKKRYKRKRPDPANPANQVGLARFSRPQVEGAGEDDFDPADPEEASIMADLLTSKKMDRAAAIKYMRKRRTDAGR